MTNRWANPINNNILRDLEGTVLGSGSVDFFEAGTSSPLAVYSDPELTVSLGSYIDADAFGLLPDFHLASGTQYKMVAYDAIGGSSGAGAVKWTRDDVFGLDSAVDTRLDAIESTLDALDVADNFILNGGMRVASAAAVTATTSYLEGQVLGVFGKVANVTAGTMTQVQDNDYVSGYTSAFSGVSTDNAAATVDAQFRIESKDCFGLINQPAVFFCQVEHDVGSAVNYTITVSAANAVDDFSAITTISSGSAVSVASGTKTRIELAVADLGDVSNGIAITISAACGVVTTKEFKIGEAQLQKGFSPSGFYELPYDVVYAALNAPDFEQFKASTEALINTSGIIPVLLDSETLGSPAASIDFASVFSDNPGYPFYIVSIENLLAAGSGSGTLRARVSLNGSTFDSGANYAWSLTEHEGATVSDSGATGAVGITLRSDSMAVAGGGESVSKLFGRLVFTDVHDTLYRKPVSIKTTSGRYAASSGAMIDIGNGYYSAGVDAITGFQVVMTGGPTLAAGTTVKVYGYNVPL
jgi:hypothetical protein